MNIKPTLGLIAAEKVKSPAGISAKNTLTSTRTLGLARACFESSYLPSPWVPQSNGDDRNDVDVTAKTSTRSVYGCFATKQRVDCLSPVGTSTA